MWLKSPARLKQNRKKGKACYSWIQFWKAVSFLLQLLGGEMWENLFPYLFYPICHDLGFCFPLCHSSVFVFIYFLTFQVPSKLKKLLFRFMILLNKQMKETLERVRYPSTYCLSKWWSLSYYFYWNKMMCIFYGNEL